VTRALRRVAALALFLSLVAACAPRNLVLPSGSGEPLPGFREAMNEASATCRDVRSLAAELGISGRVGSERLRGRVTAGMAEPASIRLEGTAPFGPPVFILVAAGASATLLLPRDNRILTGEPPASILQALVGLDLGPADLLAVLTGCVVRDPQPVSGRAFGRAWARIDLADGTAIFLERDPRERWRIRAGLRGHLRVEYPDDAGRPGRTPAVVRVRVDTRDGQGSDLRISLSQVDLNPSIDADVFAVKVPPDAVSISLAELRGAGPMGEKR
jgi:hypothetical protein